MRKSMIIHPEEISKKWIDKLCASGVEIMGIHPHGGAQAKKFIAELVEQMKTEEYRSLIDYALKKGLTIEYEMHTAGYLMPSELFDEHPEYFRMKDTGERTPDFNFCVSSEEALELFSDRALALAESLYGSCDNFYFWLDDNRDAKCHCPKCQSLSHSDQQMITINAMIRKIRTKFPKAKMAYLAYLATIFPPTAVKAEPGIFMEYAPIAKYTLKDEVDVIENEKQALMPLMEYFGDEPKRLLEYWYDNSLFSKWKKPPVKFTLDRERMIADMQSFAPLGFDSVATFACFLGEDYDALYGETDIDPFARDANEYMSKNVD